MEHCLFFFFFFQAEDGIRDKLVTGVQTCALPISPTLRGQRGLPTVLFHVGGQRKDVGGVLPQLGRDGEFTLSATRQHETQHQNPVTPPGAVVVLRQRLALFDVCHESVDAALIVNIHTRNLACYRTRNGFPTRRECLCGSSSTSPRRWPPSSSPGSGGAPLSRLPVPRFDGRIGRDYEGWARSSAQANRRAALCTGVAALPQGVASVLTARTRKRRRVRETSRDISRSPEAHMCCSFSSSYVRAHSLHSTFES